MPGPQLQMQPGTAHAGRSCACSLPGMGVQTPDLGHLPSDGQNARRQPASGSTAASWSRPTSPPGWSAGARRRSRQRPTWKPWLPARCRPAWPAWMMCSSSSALLPWRSRWRQPAGTVGSMRASRRRAQLCMSICLSGGGAMLMCMPGYACLDTYTASIATRRCGRHSQGRAWMVSGL